MPPVTAFTGYSVPVWFYDGINRQNLRGLPLRTIPYKLNLAAKLNLPLPTAMANGRLSFRPDRQPCKPKQLFARTQKIVTTYLGINYNRVIKREILLNTVSLFFTVKYLGGEEWLLWSFCGIFPNATDLNFIYQKYPRIRVIIKYLELTRSIIPLGRCNGFSAEQKVVSR